MIPLADAERLLATVKELVARRRAADRLSGRARNADIGSGASSKASTALSWAAMHVVQAEAAVHAAAVDAGVADLREPQHYADQIHRPSGWHEYLFVPPKPRSASTTDLDRAPRDALKPLSNQASGRNP